jgi:putative ABC transport system permease protein
MMRLGLILQLFWRSSRVQKKRAVLTIAAIAWGSLSLVMLLAFGEGLGTQLSLAGAGMGSNLAIMWPGETTIPYQGMPAGRPIRPRIADIELLESRMQGMAGISGELTNSRTSYTWGDKTVNGRLVGASLVYGEMRNHIPRMGGRFLNPLDDAQRRRSIFIGFSLAEDLFGEVDPIGKTLLVDEVPYTVVGVMVDKMQNNSYGGMDKDQAVIPIRTFWAHFGQDRLNVIVIKAADPGEMTAKIAQVREILGAKYGFSPEDERVLGTWNTVESSEIMKNMMLGIQMFLGIIGVLTLTVGGIGVANIMYAVVKERTREIGVKMALGARPGWVTGPIVLEGLTYTLLGGLLGLLMATIAIVLLGLIPVGNDDALAMLGKPTLSIPIATTTAGILGVIGLLAGYFPARRAAGVDPAQTLRYE